jgi:hypothetical protein
MRVLMETGEEMGSLQSRSGRGPRAKFWFLEGFNPQDLLPARFWRHAEAIGYVVGLVASRPVFSPCSAKERRGWVPLRWVDLAPLFGKSGNWNAIREALLAGGVLECDEHYKIGERAKGYRLGPTWSNREQHLATIRNRRLLVRIANVQAKQQCGILWVPEHEHLDHWLRQVRVDEATARPWICHQRRSRRQHYTALRVAAIQSGESSVTVDSYGRVHSPITNLKRYVRPALRIHGQPLIETDVSSCQPLLIGFMAAKLLVGDWGLAQVKHLGSEGPIWDGFANLPMERWRADLPQDLLDYIGTCERGLFYQALADAWGLPFESPSLDPHAPKKR